MTWQEALGQQIRDARKKAGLTQEGLGDAVGKTRQMIGRYESGTDSPSVDVLGKIALQLAMTEININGYHFAVAPQTAPPGPQATEQLKLDFDKEYTYSGATLRIKPNKVTITITVTAMEPATSIST